MYQPRRVADPADYDAIELFDDFAVAAAARPGPRRARQGFGDKVRAKVTPTAVAMAMSTGAAAFVIVPTVTQQDDPVTSAVPAGDRAAATTSRDQARPALAEETPAAEQGSKKAAPVVTAEWTSAFSAMAGTQYAKGAVQVHAAADGGSAKLGTLKRGDSVQVTERIVSGYREVVFDKKIAYVKDAEISKNKQTARSLTKSASSSRSYGAAATASVAGSKAKSSGKSNLAPGKTSSKRVLGLTSQAMGVYNAVMSRWGGRIKSVGGYRKHSLSDHQYGRAIDFMLRPGKDSAMGWEIANYLAANYKSLGVDHIIFEQKIWTPYKKRWRPMKSRGSITANHYDHVHVSVER